MESLFCFVDRLAGDVDAQAAEDLLVHRGEDDRGMDLAAAQLVQLLHRKLGGRVGGRADGEGDQHLVGVQARVAVAQMVDLQVLDRPPSSSV